MKLISFLIQIYILRKNFISLLSKLSNILLFFLMLPINFFFLRTVNKIQMLTPRNFNVRIAFILHTHCIRL